MSDSVLMKVAAVAAGLIYLAALAICCAASGHSWDALLALLGLGACVLCYNAGVWSDARPTKSPIAAMACLLFWALSWVFGVAATIYFFMDA